MIKKGAFHRWLGKHEDEQITDEDIQTGMSSTDPHVQKMAQFAKNMKKGLKECALREIVALLREGIDFQKRDVSSDYMVHKKKNRTIHHFTTRIQRDLVDVMFELENQSQYYVEFAVNEKMKLAKDKSTSFAIQVMSYVVTCIKHVSDMSSTKQFYFLADAEHEAKYDKLMPILSNKFKVLIDKQPAPPTAESKRKRRESASQNELPPMTAMYIIKVNEGN